MILTVLALTGGMALVDEPQPLIRISPTHPETALELGVDARCVVEFDLADDGVPRDVDTRGCVMTTVSSERASELGNDRVNAISRQAEFDFEQAAERAVARWRYGLSDGAESVQVEVSFD